MTNQAFMNDQVLRIILILFGLLTTIIGFMLAIYFKRGIDSIDKLNESVGDLRLALSGLKAQFIAREDIDSLNKESCKDRHTTIDTHLRDNDETLKDHSERIVIIETRVGIER